MVDTPASGRQATLESCVLQPDVYLPEVPVWHSVPMVPTLHHLPSHAFPIPTLLTTFPLLFCPASHFYSQGPLQHLPICCTPALHNSSLHTRASRSPALHPAFVLNGILNAAPMTFLQPNPFDPLPPERKAERKDLM